MAALDDGEVLAVVEAREATALGFDSGELAEQRAEALRRFLQEPFGDEKDGRSQVVSSDLRDTVLWIMPQLLRTFLGTDEVLRFDATGPEDEQLAQQETDVVNHIATNRNNAFIQFNAAFQDALLCGAGYLKTYWHSDESVQIERYFGKADDELAMLLQDPEVEVVEQTDYPDPDWMDPGPQIDPATGQQVVQQRPMLHDAVLRRVVVDEYARYEAVPPEELRVSKHARSVCLQDIDFVEHIRQVTISDLREMGYEVDDSIGGFDDYVGDDERLVRDRWDDDTSDGEDMDPAMRRVWYREAYVLLDYDGDGKAERRKICVVGQRILANEETDSVPFAAIAPVLFAHRHVGLSIYDLLREIEVIRTTVMRGYLDGMYRSLNPRTAIDVNSVNMDDMLVSVPGGVVRTMGSPHDKVMPLVSQDTGPVALQGLQWLDQWRQDASGVSPYFQGGAALDATSLNKTAAGVSQMVSQAQMRIEAIARSFADTGIRDLFLLLHQLTLKHARKAMTVKLRNQWVTVDPREWKKRTNIVVSVALGSGTKEMRAAQLQQMIALQLQVAPLGLATPDKLYNSISRLANELGYRNPDEFVSNPAMMPPVPPPPPDPLVQAEQIKAQASLQKAQMDIQARQSVDQRELAIKQAEMQQSADLERFKTQLQMEQARFEAELKASTQIQIAQITEGIKSEAHINTKRLDIETSERERERQGMSESQMGVVLQSMQELQAMVQALAQEVARAQQPKQIVRDQRGRVVGVAGADGQMLQELVRDASGRVAGIAPTTNIQ